MPKNYLEKMNPDKLRQHTDKHYFFTQSNGVTIIKMFLTAKVPKNEDMLMFMSDPWLKDAMYSKQNPGSQSSNFE